MPLGVKPKCHICKISFSVMWRKNENGEIICNSCTVRPPNKRNSCPFNFRRSTRAKSSRTRHAKTQQVPKGKSRRSIVFKTTPPSKSPSLFPSTSTTSHFFYEGQYFQIGDIVSVTGEDDNTYYAQIRGLVIDQYGKKSAYLCWLLPVTDTSDEYFDPSGYTLGESEDFPRKMEYITFVCHAPPEFYKKTGLVPVKPTVKETGFIWTSIGPRVIPIPTQAEVFGAEPEDLV